MSNLNSWHVRRNKGGKKAKNGRHRRLDDDDGNAVGIMLPTLRENGRAPDSESQGSIEYQTVNPVLMRGFRSNVASFFRRPSRRNRGPNVTRAKELAAFPDADKQASFDRRSEALVAMVGNPMLRRQRESAESENAGDGDSDVARLVAGDGGSSTAPDADLGKKPGKKLPLCKRRWCRVLSVCCALFWGLVLLVFLSLYDLYYLLLCTTRKTGTKCFDIYRVHVTELCSQDFGMLATVFLDNPSRAKLHVGNVQGTMVDDGEDRAVGHFRGAPTFVQHGTGAVQDRLWYGRQNVSMPLQFNVEDEALFGEIGIKRMNKVDFSVTVTATVDVGVTVTPFPRVMFQVTQGRRYMCWNEPNVTDWKGEPWYRCHLGNDDPPPPDLEKAKKPPGNRTVFKAEEIEVMGDSDVGNNTVGRMGFAMDLGDLFVTAVVPKLNVHVWYDPDDHDPMTRRAPVYTKEAFAQVDTTPNMFFHSTKFGWGKMRSSGYGSLRPPQDRTDGQFEDVNRVIRDFVFLKKKVPLYVRGPRALRADACMAQRVASKMPPFYIALKLENQTANESTAPDPCAPPRNDTGAADGEAGTTGKDVVTVHNIHFGGLQREESQTKVATMFTAIVFANFTLRLPFLFYGEFPPVQIDFFSDTDRWVGIQSPNKFVYNRTEALRHAPIVVGLVASPTFGGNDGLMAALRKANGVARFQDMKFNIEGSTHFNAISRVMKGMNIPLAQGEPASTCEGGGEPLKDGGNHVSIDVNLTSPSMELVRCDSHIVVPSFSHVLPFPMYFPAFNFTLKVNQSDNARVDVVSTKFALGLVSTDDKVPFSIGVMARASDGGAEFRSVVERFVTGNFNDFDLSVRSGDVLYSSAVDAVVPDGGGQIEFQFTKLQEYITSISEVYNVTTGNATNTTAIELGSTYVFSLDTDGSVLDVDCLLNRSCTGTTEKMKLKAELGLDVLLRAKLPLDIELAIPTVRLNAFETTDIQAKTKEGGPLGYVDVLGATYHYTNVSGDFTVLGDIRVPDAQRAYWLFQPEKRGRNVSTLFQVETRQDLFNAIMSEFVFGATTMVAGTESTSGPGAEDQNASAITQLGLTANVTTEEDTMSLDVYLQFKVATKLMFSFASASMDVWPFRPGGGGNRRRLRDTPTLDACYPHSLRSQCKVASVRWDEFHIGPRQLTKLHLSLDIAAPARLLADVGNDMLDGELVNPRIRGEFVLPSYSGPLRRTHGASEIWLKLPAVDGGAEAEEETESAPSVGLERLVFKYMRTLGNTPLDLPCIFGATDYAECHAFHAEDGDRQRVEAGVGLNITVPPIKVGDDTDIRVTLPNIGIKTTVVPIATKGSGCPDYGALPVGAVGMEAVDFSSADNTHLALGFKLTATNMTSYHTLLASLDPGCDSLAISISGDDTDTTLVNKVLMMMEKNVTLSFNTSSSKADAAPGPKPTVSGTFGSSDAGAVLHLTMNVSDGAYAPGFAMGMGNSEWVFSEDMGGAVDPLFRVQINDLMLWPGEGGIFQTSLQVDTPHMKAAKATLSSLWNGDDALIRVKGKIGEIGDAIDLKVIVGAIEAKAGTGDRPDAESGIGFSVDRINALKLDTQGTVFNQRCLLDRGGCGAGAGGTMALSAILAVESTLNISLPVEASITVQDIDLNVWEYDTVEQEPVGQPMSVIKVRSAVYTFGEGSRYDTGAEINVPDLHRAYWALQPSGLDDRNVTLRFQVAAGRTPLEEIMSAVWFETTVHVDGEVSASQKKAKNSSVADLGVNIDVSSNAQDTSLDVAVDLQFRMSLSFSLLIAGADFSMYPFETVSGRRLGGGGGGRACVLPSIHQSELQARDGIMGPYRHRGGRIKSHNVSREALRARGRRGGRCQLGFGK